jgi:hypothetical protein
LYLLGKPFDEIDWPTLERARDEKIEESRTLDFKRDAPDIESRESKKEFLEDICAFANTYGGLLLYGVDEARDANTKLGHIDSLPGIPEPSADFKPRVQELVRSSFDPRFSGVSLGVIESNDGKRFLKVGVERSPQAPHRVISNGSREFMRRTLTSTEKMDANEIREAVRRSIDASQDARDRLQKLAETASSVRFTPNPALPNQVTLWGCALPAFQMTLPEPIGSPVVSEALQDLAPTHAHNFGGVAVRYDHYGAFISPSTSTDPVLDRLRHNGTVERFDFVDIAGQGFGDSPKYIHHAQLLNGLEQLGRAIVSLRQKSGIGGPMLVAVGLFGIKGLRLHQIHAPTPDGGQRARELPALIDTDAILLEPQETSDEFFGRMISAAANLFWNAGGHPYCAGFDDDGRRTPGIP